MEGNPVTAEDASAGVGECQAKLRAGGRRMAAGGEQGRRGILTEWVFRLNYGARR